MTCPVLCLHWSHGGLPKFERNHVYFTLSNDSLMPSGKGAGLLTWLLKRFVILPQWTSSVPHLNGLFFRLNHCALYCLGFHTHSFWTEHFWLLNFVFRSQISSRLFAHEKFISAVMWFLPCSSVPLWMCPYCGPCCLWMNCGNFTHDRSIVLIILLPDNSTLG